MQQSIQSIANALKSARLDRQWTQAQLGRKAGIPQSHISKIESGKVDLSLSSLIELSRVLGLDVTLLPVLEARSLRAVLRTAKQSNAPDRQQPAYQLTDDD